MYESTLVQDIDKCFFNVFIIIAFLIRLNKDIFTEASNLPGMKPTKNILILQIVFLAEQTIYVAKV